MTLSVGIAIITHSAKKHLQRCLPPLLHSPIRPKVLLVNSSSEDGTVEEAKRIGVETLVIPRRQFNHGTTRERARLHLNCDIVIMMTPDAYATGPQMVEKLINPIAQGISTIAYARQLPHHDADPLTCFARRFNYPPISHVRGIQEVERYGIYTFFCSDACAAYSNTALESIGGFPPVLLGEDTYVTAKLLRAGHKIAYVAEATVQHSHNYTVMQEFRRYFDTGLQRRAFGSLLDAESCDSSLGKKFTKELFLYLIRHHPKLLPYAINQTLFKWIGYKVGRTCLNAPLAIRSKLSSQDYFWNSESFKENSLTSNCDLNPIQTNN